MPFNFMGYFMHYYGCKPKYLFPNKLSYLFNMVVSIYLYRKYI